MSLKERDPIELAQVEDSLRQQCLGDLRTRAERWLEVQRVPIAPSTHFALPSAECSLLYRDGYNFACIALCQAVAEALVRYLCDQNPMIRRSKSFETNLSRIKKARVLEAGSIEALERVWADRDDFLHINPSVSRDTAALQQTALAKLRDLAVAERDAFAADYSGGKLSVDMPKHWPQS